MSGPDIEITAPDGSVVVFPAGTSDEVIAQAMRVEYGGPESADLYDPQNSLPDDQLRELAGNTPPEVEITKGVQNVNGRAVVRGENGEPDQDLGSWEEWQAAHPTDEPPNPVMDALKSFPGGVGRGVAGFLGFPVDMFNLAGKSLGVPPEVVRAAGGLANIPMDATSDTANNAIQSVLGNYHEPETVAGQYSRTVGEFVPNAVAPGGLMTKAASVLAPALLSETAGQLTKGTSAEPYARFAGGLAGGLGVGGVSGLRSGASNVIRNATENITPEQLQMAEALASRSPIPLTTAERVQQVTGGSTGLGRLQRVVEGSNQRLGPMMSERPQAVQGAVQNVMDQIAPPSAPQAVAGQAQEAAGGVLDTMRRRVNESAQPFYDQLPGQTLSPDDYATLQANPSYAAAEQEVTRNPELAAMLSGGPEDLSTVNRVTTQLGQMADQARPGQMNPMGNNTIASQRDQAAALARQLAGDTSPDFATARQTVATGNEAFIDPLKRGPIGAIANQQELQPNLNAQLQRHFPVKANEGSAQETAQALRMMGEVDPTVAPALTRQHIATEANTALRDLSGGPNQFGGAQLAANIAGSGERAAALLAAVDTAAPMASRDTRDLIEALRATGQRERPGSNTSFNNELMGEMRGGNLGQALAQTITNPTGVPGRIARGFDDMIARANSNKIADLLLADPEEATRIINRARATPRGGNAIRLATALGSLGQDQ